jgi:hypothetical protein
MLRAALLLASVCLLGPGLIPAQTISALETAREFYTWYVPIAQKSDGLAAVLKLRPNALTPALTDALKADRAASAKVKDEIVGLDGDPFLDTQDPCERYEVGIAAPGGTRALVPIYSVCQGTRSPKPAFTVELLLQKDKWQIANIHFQRGGDLMGLLAQLKKDREKPKE